MIFLKTPAGHVLFQDAPRHVKDDREIVMAAVSVAGPRTVMFLVALLIHLRNQRVPPERNPRSQSLRGAGYWMSATFAPASRSHQRADRRMQFGACNGPIAS